MKVSACVLLLRYGWRVTVKNRRARALNKCVLTLTRNPVASLINSRRSSPTKDKDRHVEALKRK